MRETFLLRQFFGTALIIVAIILVSWKKQTLIFKKEDFYVLFAAFMFGIGLVNDSFIVRSFDVPTYFFYGQIAPAFLIVLVYPKTIWSFTSMIVGKNLLKFIILGFFYTIQLIAYYLAYQVGRNAAQITAINQISTILIVILGIVFLKERSGIGKKIVGALLSIFGVIMIK